MPKRYVVKKMVNGKLVENVYTEEEYAEMRRKIAEAFKNYVSLYDKSEDPPPDKPDESI